MRPQFLTRPYAPIDSVHPAVLRTRNPRKSGLLTWAAIAATGAWLGWMFGRAF